MNLVTNDFELRSGDYYWAACQYLKRDDHKLLLLRVKDNPPACRFEVMSDQCGSGYIYEEIVLLERYDGPPLHLLDKFMAEREAEKELAEELAL